MDRTELNNYRRAKIRKSDFLCPQARLPRRSKERRSVHLGCILFMGTVVCEMATRLLDGAILAIDAGSIPAGSPRLGVDDG